MNDEGVVVWSTFGGEDAGDGRCVRGVGSQTIDGFGGKRNWRSDSVLDRLDGGLEKATVGCAFLDIVLIYIDILSFTRAFRQVEVEQADYPRVAIAIRHPPRRLRKHQCFHCEVFPATGYCSVRCDKAKRTVSR